MEYLVTNKQQKECILSGIKQMVEATCCLVAVKYIVLGAQTVRVLCYTDKILPLMQQQMTYVLRDDSDNYDATIVVWHEKDLHNFLAVQNNDFNPRKNMRLRLDNVMFHNFYIRIRETQNLHSVFVEVNENAGKICAFDKQTQTWYLGLTSFEPEKVIQYGHLFVQQLYQICALPTRHLVHGAVVGLNNCGVLVCARGGRGKSTLTVKALLDGFDYVSDDYLLLDKENSGLYASPIYSIITLSPKMYQKMYDNFRAKFVSNNARLDKYVFNIAAYHRQFREHYPIKMLLFPQIVADEEPSIVSCNKGQAVTQLIHSTISQNGDINNTGNIKKLLDFIQVFDCYQINLSPDIVKNVQCLKSFLITYKGK